MRRLIDRRKQSGIDRDIRAGCSACIHNQRNGDQYGTSAQQLGDL